MKIKGYISWVLLGVLLAFILICAAGCTRLQVDVPNGVSVNYWTVGTNKEFTYNPETGGFTYTTNVDPLTEAIKRIP